MNETNNEREVIDADEVLPEAPLTSSTNKENQILKYRFGRKVIRIPLSQNTVNEKTIENWLPYILNVHVQNVSDINHLENVYLGKSHIWDKVRNFSSDKKNNIVNENHAFYMVEFKKGYMFGNDVQFSIADESMSTDEIKYFNKYMKDQEKSNKNIEIAESVFKTGNGYRFIIPRKTDPTMDLSKLSPYELYNLDNKNSFVVYSSDFTRRKLFGGIITSLDSPNTNEVTYELMIYDKYYAYRFSCDKYGSSVIGLKFLSKQRHFIGHIPFVEYYANSSRLGVVELVESILDAVNSVSSDSLDAINDWVNSILAIYNMTIDCETKKTIEEAGAISLTTTDPTRPADAKFLVNQLEQADVMTRYETLIKVAYNIAGVPQPTTKSTSGGDTGEARELGGGHTNADIVANQQEEPLKQAIKAELDVCLEICKKTPNCPVKTLYPCDLDVNFSRKKNNNLLVKTQSLQTLVNMGMPKEVALNIVELTANNHEVAKKWDELVEKKEKTLLQNKQQEEKTESDNEVAE